MTHHEYDQNIGQPFAAAFLSHDDARSAETLRTPRHPALGRYIDRGVKRVVVSAPVKEPDVLNVVVGVNDDQLTEAPGGLLRWNLDCGRNGVAPKRSIM